MATASTPSLASTTGWPSRRTRAERISRSLSLSSAISTFRASASADAEELLKIGDREDAPDIAVAVLNRDTGTVSTGMVPQQEQHTQGGAVEVSGVGEIDHITVDAGITVLISVTEGLMSAEIKTALYPDCQSLTVVTPRSEERRVGKESRPRG